MMRLFLVIAGLASVSPAFACVTHYYRGTAPAIRVEALAASTATVCKEAFTVVHGGLSRTPLWSAERLTPALLDAARGQTRETEFHPEATLPPAQRAELADYARSGFDRGHLAPAADMPSPRAMQESFSLANIVPQDRENNRNAWADVESAVRNLCRRKTECFIVTGPVFQGERLRRIGGRVLVPSHLFKAVLIPGEGAAAYLSPNQANGVPIAIPLDRLESLAGIDVFPALDPVTKSSPIPLPKPVPRTARTDDSTEPAAKALNLIQSIARRL